MAAPDPATSAALEVLRASVRRAHVAHRLQGGAEERLLRSIVEATVTLFDAEACSIALHERDPDRLVFRVAAGPQGAAAVGLSVPVSQGIVGYVYSTGQAIALSDVASDPRFDRATAERTGYVPRSIAAAPLVDEGQTIGVLQLLDKRGEPTFSLRDMELLAVFAGQAAAAIRATRVQRDTTRFLREVLATVGDQPLDAGEIDRIVAAAALDLDDSDDAPFWTLVEQVSRLRTLTDREHVLVAAILETIARFAERPIRRR